MQTLKTTNKDDIRKTLINKRRKLPTDIQQQKSLQISNQIKQNLVFKQAKNIALYHAVRGEADPAALAEKAAKETQFYLPIISPDKDQGLLFAPINQDTQFKHNQFLIPEPMVKPSELIRGEELDLVIMPLLGFDNSGSRLGMGGGYYDRCFSFKKTNTRNPILMGFAYDFQEISFLKTESWDIGLDMLTTESRSLTF